MVKYKHEKFIDNLRVIGAACVVLIHVTGYQTNITTECLYFKLNNVFRSAGVGIFYLLSGFLLHTEFVGNRSFTDYIKKRFWKLIVPLVGILFMGAMLRSISIYVLMRNWNFVELKLILYRNALSIIQLTAAPHLYFLVSLFMIEIVWLSMWKLMQKKIYQYMLFILYSRNIVI